jgi:hypothetical protein
MKSFVFIIVLFLSATILQAQDCKGFYYLNNGEIQITSYDKKSDETGKLTYTMTGAANAGATASANFTTELVNKKGKTLSKGSGIFKCDGGTLYVDAKTALSQEQLAAYKDMEIKASDTYIEYPSSLETGQTLKEVNFSMEVYNKGSLFSTLTFEEINRKVDGKETFTTHAGSWDCWKISYEVKFKVSVPPMNMGVPVTMECTEWFAPGFGVVKTETYNKEGKMIGFSQITSVKK